MASSFLIGLPIAIASLLAWLNQSASDFKDGFEQKTEEKNK